MLTYGQMIRELDHEEAMSTTGQAPAEPYARLVAAAVDRAEAAEAKLAALRTVLLEGGQDAYTVRRRALAIIISEEDAGHG